METLEVLLNVSSIGAALAIALFFVMMAGISRLPKIKFSFAMRVLIGTGNGAVYGIAVWFLTTYTGIFAANFENWLGLISDGFLNLFRMLLSVAVFTATVRLVLHTPVENDSDPKKKQRKHVAAFMVFVSALIGLITAVIMGAGNLPGEFGHLQSAEHALTDMVSAILPSDWIGDLFINNVAGVMAAAWFIGVAARRMAVKKPEQIKPFSDLVDSFFAVLTSVCKAVIAWKPMGAAAITAVFVITQGPVVLLKFVWFIAILLIGVLIMFLFQLIVIAVSGISPIRFIRESSALIKRAIVTHNGGGCVEPAIDVLVNKLDISEEVAREVVPYSMSSAMQGCGAMFPAIVFVFAANLSGISIDLTTLIVAAALITIASFGITGLPGTATMSEFAVVLGMPVGMGVHNIGPAVALDPAADVIRTPLNVTGCMANAIYINSHKR